MAKNQKILNKNSDQLFMKIGESKVKDGVIPPMINTVLQGDGMGVPMTDVSSPTKILPAVLAVAGRFALGRLGKWAVKKGVQKSMKGLIKNKAGRLMNQVGGGFAKPGSTGMWGTVGNALSYVTGTSKLGRAASYAGFGLTGMFGGSGGDSNEQKAQDLINKGKKITGKLGSELRKQQYDAKGWKHDHTISGDHEGSYGSDTKRPKVKPVNVIKPSGTKPVETKPVSTHQPISGGDKNVIKSRKQQKKEKLTNKANLAAAQGNYNKANRLNRRSNRVSPNAVNLDLGVDYSRNLQQSSTANEITSQPPAQTSVTEKYVTGQATDGKKVDVVDLTKKDDKGTPFKFRGIGPLRYGARK